MNAPARPPPSPRDALLLLDCDDLILSPGKTGALPMLAARLDAASDTRVVLVSGLRASEIDRAFVPHRIPLMASFGWEFRSEFGGEVIAEPAPAGLDLLLNRLERLRANQPGVSVTRTPAGAEVDASSAPESLGACQTFLQQCVGELQGWRTVALGIRFGLIPSTLKKDHAIRRLLSESRFRGRIPVYVADNLAAADGFRLVQRQRGLCVKIGSSSPRADHGFAHWDLALNWLSEALPGLGANPLHADGRDAA